MNIINQAERDEALATLNEMTKAEIICWLSGDAGMLFRPPRKSQLFAARWKAANDAVMARREKNNLGDGVAKNMDRLNAELSKAKDHKTFAAIAKELKPYNDAFLKWRTELMAIQKEEGKVNALWDEYTKQDEKERKAIESGERI